MGKFIISDSCPSLPFLSFHVLVDNPCDNKRRMMICPFVIRRKAINVKWFARFPQKYLVGQIKYCIFAPLESATLPIDQRTRAELFVYIHL